MNAPDPIDNVMIPLDDQGVPLPLVSATVDDVLQNAAMYHVLREDHTVGNILRMQLLDDDRVLFAGYHIRHPLEKDIFVKVQTTADTTPSAALLESIEALKGTFKGVEASFRETLAAAEASRVDAYY